MSSSEGETYLMRSLRDFNECVFNEKIPQNGGDLDPVVWELKKILEPHKANINIKDANGLTPLMHFTRELCIREGDVPEIWYLIEAIKLLIAIGADINTTDENGFSPLMYLRAFKGRDQVVIDVITLFVHLGADDNMNRHYTYCVIHASVSMETVYESMETSIENISDISMITFYESMEISVATTSGSSMDTTNVSCSLEGSAEGETIKVDQVVHVVETIARKIVLETLSSYNACTDIKAIHGMEIVQTEIATSSVNNGISTIEDTTHERSKTSDQLDTAISETLQTATHIDSAFCGSIKQDPRTDKASKVGTDTKRMGKIEYGSWNELFTKISPQIGHSSYTIFINLGFTSGEYETSQKNNPNDANSGNINLLTIWDKRQSKDVDKRKVLTEALQKSGRADLADMVWDADISEGKPEVKPQKRKVILENADNKSKYDEESIPKKQAKLDDSKASTCTATLNITLSCNLESMDSGFNSSTSRKRGRSTDSLDSTLCFDACKIDAKLDMKNIPVERSPTSIPNKKQKFDNDENDHGDGDVTLKT